MGAQVRPDSTWGTRTYYLNDGDDVALTLVRGSGPTWRYHQRYLLTGLDEVAALRLSLNGVPTNLAVVADRQGSFLMAVDAAGAEAPAAGFYLTGPFGQLESGSAAATDGGTHAGLGFTGAGTATPSGGYVYLRNRWYDPRTGRFLSQDPIGLAGGVNLYAYAGNNPIAYSDPFGLCANAQSDSILIDVKVICPDGRTMGKRQVWAHRVSDPSPLLQAASRLKGGSTDFTPAGVLAGYSMMASIGSVYVFPTRSDDGLLIEAGAQTRTGASGGGPQYTAFSSDAWDAIVAGDLDRIIGNMDRDACEIVGHEGVHLVQSTGVGRGGEEEAYSVTWSCQ